MKKKINNVTKILVLVLMIFSLSGCTKYLKNDDGKQVKNETTGQVLTKNILCKPTDKEIIKIYESYNKSVKKSSKVDLKKLEECSTMKINGKYESLWTNIFVKPLAWVIIKIGNLVKSYGLSLILVTILIRAIVMPITLKTAKQSKNMQKAKPELEKLEKKYQNKNDQEAMMQKSQEIMMLYKKYGINPMSGCLFSFIQIPLFFAFYEAIGRIPVIFEETFLGFQLGTSPLTAVLNGKFHYIIFIVLIAAATYFSFKLNSSVMSDEQAKQMKLMQNIMVVMMTITAFSISSGIAIYWVTSNVFTIVQNLIVKRGAKDV